MKTNNFLDESIELKYTWEYQNIHILLNQTQVPL